MCGILNVISKTRDPLDLSLCRRSLSLLNWRGPHLFTHTELNGRIFFGQTILSITGDLSTSDGSHLESATGRFLLGYNGEVYNYKNLADNYLKHLNIDKSLVTDSEIIVNLHDVLSADQVPFYIDGMYAYTILDHATNTITLVRDLQGEKTLYIYEDENILIISSEIRPILAMNNSINVDKNSLRDYFHTRHMMLTDRTAYEGIYQLQPGEIKTFNLNSNSWSNSLYQNSSDLIDKDLYTELYHTPKDLIVKELYNLIEKSIIEMTPDHSFASVLSGGVDSSLVSGILSKHASPDMYVAVNHVGKDNISNDLIAFESIIDNDIDVLDVDLEMYSSEIERCQKVCGSPLLSHSFIGQSLQSRLVRSRQCRVLFGGEGADELFGGYAAYLNISDKSLNADCSPSPYSRFSDTSLIFENYDSQPLRELLKTKWKESLEKYSHIVGTHERILQAAMFCDFNTQLSSVGLRGSDFMSMMWSIESRSVFVRKLIVEFALNLPIKYKVDPLAAVSIMKSKPLLKQVFNIIYPSDLLVQKQGFSGFPNESLKYLGRVEDFIVFDYLNINRDSLNIDSLDKEVLWKLINVEYFIRSN